MVLVETQFDRLTVYDLQTKAASAYLTISEETKDWHYKKVEVDYPYRTQQMSIHKFDEIKVSLWFLFCCNIWTSFCHFILINLNVMF